MNVVCLGLNQGWEGGGGEFTGLVLGTAARLECVLC